MTVGIGILCKLPRPGIAKTRLARGVGQAAALRLADAFLRDVVATASDFVRGHDARLFAFCRPTDGIDEMRSYFSEAVPVLAQEGDDLGAMMRNAIARMLAECRDGAFVMGCDIPQLPAAVLAEAVETLRAPGPKAVIGPSADGGYYLIGMTDLSFEGLLAPLPWSTPDVYRLTVERARDRNLSLHPLAQLFDIDELAELDRLRALLADAPPGIAPHTRAVLRDL